MNIAIDLLLLVLGALAAAGFTDLFSFSIGDPGRYDEAKPGRILSRYGMWLDQRFQDFEAVTRELKASKVRVAQTEKALRLARAWDRVNPYKVLGVCPRCANVWVSALVFVWLALFAGLSWWWLAPFLGLSGVALGLVEKLR